MAKATAGRILKTAPNVFVLKRKCACSRKKSRLWRLGCMTVFWTSSGCASPKISMAVTCSSIAWPAPWEATSVPVKANAEAVVMRFNKDSSHFSKSITACKLAIQEPSLSCTKRLERKALTHPLTTISWPCSASWPAKIWAMRILFMLQS